MQREFLKHFQVNGTPLPDAIIDAILEEHGRDLEAAKAVAREQRVRIECISRENAPCRRFPSFSSPLSIMTAPIIPNALGANGAA